MVTPEKQLESVIELVKRCQRQHFWGDVVLTIKDGDIKLATKRETLPMEKLARRIENGKQAQSSPENAEPPQG